jgi:hypothetical protein
VSDVCEVRYVFHSSVADPEFSKRGGQTWFLFNFPYILQVDKQKKKGFWFLKGDGSPCFTHGSSHEVLLNYKLNFSERHFYGPNNYIRHDLSAIVTLNDNIHCIRSRTGLRLKRVIRLLYALNYQVSDKPVSVWCLYFSLYKDFI